MATYRTGIQTRSKIKNAARLLFQTHGIVKTTYAKIADAADVDISSIVYHFKNFDNLLLIVRNEMVLERRELIRQKIEQAFPGEVLSDLTLLVTEFRVAVDLYIGNISYYNFFRDVYFRVQHRSVHTSFLYTYMRELGVTLSDDEVVMYDCLFKPFHYLVPEFVHIKKLNSSGKDIVEFLIRRLLTALGQDSAFIGQILNKADELASGIKIKCKKSFVLK